VYFAERLTRFLREHFPQVTTELVHASKARWKLPDEVRPGEAS
jgi:hypothetical protein